MERTKVMSRLDKYLTLFDCNEVAANFDRDNTEPDMDDLSASGMSIDDMCSLSGRVLG
jgi:hypothetical protein